MVDGGVVIHGSSSKAGNELVHVAHALSRPESVSRSKAIELTQGLIVAILPPFVFGKEAAEGGNVACG